MKTTQILTILAVALGLMICFAGVSEAAPIGTAWTYQGRLMDDINPADGLYDFQFRLFDDPCTGTQQEGTIEVNDLEVIEGYFTMELDFGSSVFDGDARWLEITTRPGASVDGNDFATLNPRQEVTPTPYALYALNGPGSSGFWAVNGNDIYNTNSGNVGIGTADPQSTMHIATTGPVLTLQDTDSPGDALAGYVSLRNSTGWEKGWFGYGSAFDSDLTVVNSVGDVVLNSNGQRFTLKPDGNASITTSDPVLTLQDTDGIGNGQVGYVSLRDRDGWERGWLGYGSQFNNDLMVVNSIGDVVLNSGGQRLTLKPNGYVGIGTTAPGAELEVRDDTPPSDASSGQLNISGGISDTMLIGRTSSYGFVQSHNGEPLSLNPLGNNVGIGTTNPSEKLTVRGNLLIESASTGASVLELGEGLDYAEGFDVSDRDEINAGSVLIIDADNPGKLALSNKAYDTKVAGIVAGGKGLGSGVRLGVGQFDYDVALAGRVYCNVDATEETVQAGDQLTTSGTPGYAMKAKDYDRARGAVLGKAMQSLEKGRKGQILVLVTLQ
ncbi:MAG: hypothetical protein GWN67_06270 [Phycisphaerae bacterium]|nr:hypothetical protein [Phycisphaerae bacterium]NIR62558.1 hypothetical protein [candidate division Zixibacteria bacterium]NIP51563.1 hypothetical protein [Phycisphaerae bacterium]NIS50713.1 hypothetical protein [Phycisphaerae bacterium]NIU08473.1 hypothetical protein [Phycisphaerae bacterium]